MYYYMDEGSSFNWVDILSVDLTECIVTIKEVELRTFPFFHMSLYLLDIMYVTHQYPNMGWAWQSIELAIQNYCKVLWEHKYRTKYHKICDHFLAVLYEFIFCVPAP
jgi:hypothetical protein